MSPIRKRTIFIGGFILLALVILPITLFYFQQPQQNQSHAEKTVNLSYQPTYSQTSPQLQIPAGSTFTLDVYLDPGANSVSFVKLIMDYDASKFAPAGGFIPDSTVFSQVVEGSANTPGQITTTLSIGTDLSKAITKKTKIGTIALKALDNDAANTTSAITFDSGTQALSVSSNSSYGENVIANTTPVTVQINKPQTTCGTSPGDSMLVMDTSGSMGDQAGSSGTKISNAISSANNFVDIVSGLTNNRVGLVNFSTTATLDNPLTSTFSSVKTQISALKATGDTCIQCGIDKATQEITADKRTNVKNAVILLTDGLANVVEGSSKQVTTAVAEQAALTAAATAHSQNGTVFYTIGLGQDVDSTFLTKLAESTGGQYYFSPTTDQLNTIYSQISQTLQGGSVSGLVFNDINGNGAFDSSEAGIPGVLLQLYSSGSTTPQLISTDSDGTYAIQHLCDGTYTIKQAIPQTWKQTVPTDINGYAFTMTNGVTVTDKDFGDKQLPRCSDGIDNDGNGATDSQDSTCHTDGNAANPNSYDPNKDGEHGNSTCSDSKDNNGNGLIDGQDPACHTDGNPNNPSSYDPSREEGNIPTPTQLPFPTLTPAATSTPTPVPSLSPTATATSAGTPLALNILLDGIGNAGDNANPSTSSLSNKNPGHPNRNATAFIYDINNNLTATASGTITYSSTSGSFTGTVYANTFIPTGSYTVKVRSDNHLTRLIPGVLSLASTQSNKLPSIALVAGDSNDDNQLNILDYNLLLDCYSDLAPAKACDATKKVVTDLNDDGDVNQFDYNLFIRELSNQPGD